MAVSRAQQFHLFYETLREAGFANTPQTQADSGLATARKLELSD